MFLGDAVSQAKQRRAFQPRAQIFRETVRSAESRFPGRCRPPSGFKTLICAHTINTFEVGRIYQESEKIFENIRGAAFTPLHSAVLKRLQVVQDAFGSLQSEAA